MAAPTAQEQYFLELINRARLNPLAEAQRYGIDLNKDLPAATLNALQKQPLAFNFLLNDSADAHSNWMLSADVFSHTGSGGSSPMQRMQAAGYSFTGNWWNGENIAYVGSSGAISIDASIDSLHRNLFLSAGHRENILNGAFREIGVGVQQGVFTSGGVNWNAVMATENFATSGSNKFVSGVVYNDSNRDGFYSIGEGLGGITASVKSGSSLLASQASWSAGGFSLASNYSGGVTVEFSGGGLAQQVGATFFLTGDNAKIDLVNGNTIKSSVSVQLTGAALGLELLGINDTYGYGNDLENTIIGNSGNNTLSGGSGNDTLLAGTGNDWLHGGAGNDSLDGGSGIDTAVYAYAQSAVTVDLASGTASGGDVGSDTLVSVENAYGSANNDTLYGSAADNVLTGNAGGDWLRGSAGNDWLDGGEGSDTAGYGHALSTVTVDLTLGSASGGADVGHDTLVSIENVYGSSYNDALYGNAANNLLVGNAGNDWLRGSAGNDWLDGGDGSDTAGYSHSAFALIVDLTAGTARGGADVGNDTLVSIENAYGSVYSDVLYGNAADNVLMGNAGSDWLRGSAGNDWLDGGDGSDTAGYGHSAFSVIVDLTAGTARGGADVGNDTLVNVENVCGTAFNDFIVGNAASNVLTGSGGNDRLTGNGGADRFEFSGTSFGADTITDFTDGIDTLGFFSGAAAQFSDLLISGNGSTDVSVTCSTGSVVIHGTSVITLAANDFLFG